MTFAQMIVETAHRLPRDATALAVLPEVSVESAIALGNRVVTVPSERHPLAATDFYQVLETSDVPAGVVNIVTGARDTLAKTLAEHGAVDAVWYFGAKDGFKAIEGVTLPKGRVNTSSSSPGVPVMTAGCPLEFSRKGWVTWPEASKVSTWVCTGRPRYVALPETKVSPLLLAVAGLPAVGSSTSTNGP